MAFKASSRQIKLPSKELSKLFKETLEQVGKVNSYQEKSDVFYSAVKEFKKIEGDFLSPRENGPNGELFMALGHDSGGLINESFDKIILDKSCKNIDEELKHCFSGVEEIYRQYQKIFDIDGLSEMSIKDVFNFTLKPVSKIIERKNIKLTVSTQGLDEFMQKGFNLGNENLYIIFNNILRNAAKYTPDGGQIDVSFKNVQLSDKHAFIFSVKDSGIGIPKEEIELVKTGIRASNAIDSGITGTGYGLRKVNRLLNRIWGNLDIKSDGANKGTEVNAILYHGDKTRY